MTRIYNEDGDIQRLVAFDFETFMTTDNLAAPRAVCCSFATFGEFPRAVNKALAEATTAQIRLGGRRMGCVIRTPESDDLPEHTVALVEPAVAVDMLALLLQEPTITLVGQNVSYDFGVALQHAHLMELMGQAPRGIQTALHASLLAALDADGTGFPTSESRVMDTMIREILIKNAAGQGLFGVDLASLVKKYLGVDRSADKKGAPCVKCNATGKMLVPGKRPGTMKQGKCSKCDGKKYEKPWRLKYYLLDQVPFAEWPDAALNYVIDDAMDTLLVAIGQGGEFDDEDMTSEGEVIVDKFGSVTDEAFQMRAAWSLRMAEMNGPRSDVDAIEAWKPVMEEMVQEGLRIGQEAGFVRPNGTKDMKVMQQLMSDAYETQGLQPPMTSGGKTGNSKVACNKKAFAGCGDTVLKSWHATGEGRLAKEKFIPAAERAVKAALASRPGFFVSTGRTSWAEPMMHQPPRKQGFRECWRPRPGNVFIASDWTAAEMGTLAQIQLLMFGTSAMADAINAGFDLHLVLAVELYNADPEKTDTLDYDEIKRRYEAGDEGINALRQEAKWGNFGFPGGLVATTFVSYAEGAGLIITLERAELIREAWLDRWPEMVDYLAFFKRVSFDGFTYKSWVAGMLRGDVYYTNGCNHGFQALVALALKLAMWWVTREMFSDQFGGEDTVTWEYPHTPGDPEVPREILPHVPAACGVSPLYGYRMWLSIHDEILLEGPEKGSHEAAMRLQWLMEKALEVCTPDVKVGADPTIMRVWSKKAKAVRDNGKLVPWAPAA